jgi:penicillin-binding protein 2
MNVRNSILLSLVIMLVVSACSLGGGNANNGGSATPSVDVGPGTLPPAIEDSTAVPDVQAAARAYLDGWDQGLYSQMYASLTGLSRDAITFEAFETWYKSLMLEGAINAVDYEIMQSLLSPSNAQVAYRLTLNSSLVGEITRETTMHLSLEGGDWRVVYDPTLFLPELAGGNRFSMQPLAPTRGNIYDREGQILVANAEAYAVQVLPTFITEEYNADGLVSQLSTLLDEPSAALAALIFDEDAPFLLPLGVVAADQFLARQSALEPYFDVSRFDPFFTRLYYINEAGAQMLGYTGSASQEEALELGLPIDAVIGKLGIEQWADSYLAGQRGGELYVISPQDERVTILASRDSEPSQSVYLTVDRDLQAAAQAAIQDFTGAVVVLERDTGRVLAMASSPAFDPNSANLNSPVTQWLTYFPDNAGRFFNRATQGTYPPGSIFKIISLSAAYESGIFEIDTVIDCPNFWTGIQGIELANWTVDKELPADGFLTSQQALMRSCNPWFYQIGQTLYNNDFQTLILETAQGFGLGSPTGIGVLNEVSGQILSPDDSASGSGTPVFHAVQQAIGQSTTLITPLQAAVYVAAMGNGGFLYQPQLIERIEATDGTILVQFEPLVNGELPISPETLEAVQRGMRMVVNDPRGTAYRQFASMSIVIYGKTGTASVAEGIDPHAWFIGYTSQNREDLPDIAIAVLVENIGDGSEFAAPIFRRIVENYFFGVTQTRYPWETNIGVFDPEYFIEDVEGEDDETDNGGGTVVTPSP